MLLNESDVRLSEERRKDLRREADRQRLVNESQRRQTRNNSPLWMRIWTLFL